MDQQGRTSTHLTDEEVFAKYEKVMRGMPPEYQDPFRDEVVKVIQQWGWSLEAHLNPYLHCALEELEQELSSPPQLCYAGEREDCPVCAEWPGWLSHQPQAACSGDVAEVL